MAAADNLNFSQFKDAGKAGLSAIPPQRMGIIPSHLAGMHFHHWNNENDSPMAQYEKLQSEKKLPPAKLEYVPVGDVHTTQPGVIRKRVGQYLNRKRPVSELPQMSRAGGLNWMEDGHHRYAAFALGGATHVPAMVRDYDN